jgi:HD-like signal output (HDOD) protein
MLLSRLFNRRPAAPAPDAFDRTATRAAATPPSTPAAVAAPQAPAPAEPARPRASLTPPGSPASATSALAVPVVDVERGARTQLEQRSAALLDELAAAGGQGGDAALLIRALLDGGDVAIRQPPAAAQHALTVTRDPNSTLRELTRLAEGSPTLAQALLRSANSAQYGMADAACASIPDALRRLGAQGVQNVVLTSMVQGLLCRPGAAYEKMAGDVWSHMVRTAPLARALAVTFAVAPGEAFALGLLHDVGKLVIFGRISALRSELRREVAMPYPAFARVLAALHEPLGAIPTHGWGLGAHAAEAIGAHHSGEPLSGAAADHLRQLLYVAERADLARLRGQSPAMEEWWQDGGITVSLERAGEPLARQLAADEETGGRSV